MRRQTYTRRQPELEGVDRSHELASALAQICDPETLEALLHHMTLLDAIGGQVFIAADRKKFRATPQGYIELDDHKEPGKYITTGYLFHYDHIATALRVPKEPDATFGDQPEELSNGDDPVPLDYNEPANEKPQAELAS